MRALFLSLVLGIASLGWIAVTPTQAEARHWRGYYGGYPAYYGWRGGYRGWYGGSHYRYWRGGSYYYPAYRYSWYPRYYYGSSYPAYSTYYFSSPADYDYYYPG